MGLSGAARGARREWTIDRRCVLRVSATYSARMPCSWSLTIAARLDDDHGVEFEALDHADRHDGQRLVEPGAGRPPVLEPGRGQRLRDGVAQIVGSDHRDTAAPGSSACSRRTSSSTPSTSVTGPHDPRPDVADPHRLGHPQARRRDRHHLVRQFHDLSRDAVADRQPDHPRRLAIGQVLRARRPSRSGASGPVAWAMSPTIVIDPFSERRVAILSCIGVRSCTSSITMCP